jgi:hypothetical protein
VDPLVAEVQGCGELAQRCAAEMQAADGTVELGFGDVGGMVCLDELFLRLPGRGQQLRIHASIVPRR